jgi:recombination protein RecA
MAAERSSVGISAAPGANTSEREKALEMAVSQIERRFGKGAIMKLGEARAKIFVESIPTGSVGLDLALG